MRVLIVLGLVWSLSAGAKLQNVEVNGYYNVRLEEREAAVIQTLNKNNPEEFPPAIRFNGVTTLKQVVIPSFFTKSGDAHRTFLAFYTGCPGLAKNLSPDVCLSVTVDGSRAFQCNASEPGWQLRLVDLQPWADKTVNIGFELLSCPSLDQYVLALPRLITCFGPYYAGSGGITIRDTRKGKEDRLFEVPQGIGISWEDNRIPESSLVLARVNCLTPARVGLDCSRSGRVEWTCQPGKQWLGMPVEKREGSIQVGVYVVNGEVDRGPFDIVPDFTKEDRPLLEKFGHPAPAKP